MSSQPATPEAITPSPSYTFEPEFTGQPPRPVPDRLDQGPYARRRRAGIAAAAVAGLACLVFSRAPGVDVLARYVLPLAYLHWIGLAALLLAAGGYVSLSLRRGPFAYVRDGLPLAARVIDLAKTPTTIVNGQPSTHALVAAVMFRHPQTGELTRADVKSNDFSSMRKDAYDASFKVGDDVTAVYLPGRLEKTLRLYAFLDLSPDVNIKARAEKEDSPWKVAALLALIPAFFIVLFANVYGYGRYQPVGFAYRQAAIPMVAGGLLLGGGLFAGLYLAHRREQDRLQSRALEAAASGAAIETGVPFLGRGLYGWFLRVIMALGSPLIGALTALCWCFMANAWLDRSPARPVPATVVGMVTRTHAFIFREYELEYRLQGAAETNKLLTTPEHLTTFDGPRAVAQVRDGRFGWPWVETVTPAPDPSER
jgi:hypothetical protein